MFLEPHVYADFEFLDKSSKISSGRLSQRGWMGWKRRGWLSRN
jgi:hypothetical protein